ncbi:MAG: hypothetical protein M1828_001244 [Chrysothrix sp. TS-e1954]|nr:MAG: hypothetical protein M1828_001244 [Chrysothrix sp. TS-e1954]
MSEAAGETEFERQGGNFDPSVQRQLFSPESSSRQQDQSYSGPSSAHQDRQDQLPSSSHDLVAEDVGEPEYSHESSQPQSHAFNPSPTSSTESPRYYEGRKSIKARFGLRNKSREAVGEDQSSHHHFLHAHRGGQGRQREHPYDYPQDGTLQSNSSGQLTFSSRQEAQETFRSDEQVPAEHYDDFNDPTPTDLQSEHYQHSVSQTSIGQYQPYTGTAVSPQPGPEEPPQYSQNDSSFERTPYTHELYRPQSFHEATTHNPLSSSAFDNPSVSPSIPQAPPKRGPSIIRKQAPNSSFPGENVKESKSRQNDVVDVKSFLGMPNKSNSLSSSHPRRSTTSASQASPAAVAARSGQGSGHLLPKPNSSQEADLGRKSPAPAQFDKEMSGPDVEQLMKDYKELRDKYAKVKKYYFEKDAQVTQLQNALAHQKLSQSRTSLDDGEYIARLTRLDGLIAQLAFGFRKDWREIPLWLQPWVNKEALSIGKQEMTAVGRAFISQWIVEEVFEKNFHPGLDPEVSASLQTIQKNLRYNAPALATDEEEAALTDKILTWRMTTMEGLQPILKSSEASTRRQTFVDLLNVQLISALHEHMNDPPPAGLEGGVNMIVELVVAMLSHLPEESRDVQMDYFPPGTLLSADLMKVEGGVPPLNDPMAELSESEGASLEINVGDAAETSDSVAQETEAGAQQEQSRKGFLGSIIGSKKQSPSHASTDTQRGGSATASQNELSQPAGSSVGESTGGRVRFAVLPALQIRGKTGVLQKALVFRL